MRGWRGRIRGGFGLLLLGARPARGTLAARLRLLASVPAVASATPAIAPATAAFAVLCGPRGARLALSDGRDVGIDDGAPFLFHPWLARLSLLLRFPLSFASFAALAVAGLLA